MTPGAKVALVAGKVNVVYFWATWNGPVKQSFPKLQELHLRYRRPDLAFAAVSVDDEVRGVAVAAREWGATFPVGWDEGHRIAERWKPSSMPTLYLVDRHGVIRHVFQGWHDGKQDAIERALVPMLDAKD
jgi:thiol-disulfide isomerase/thioredoxin